MKTKDKIKKISLFKPNVPQPITNLNWNQCQKRFPLMNPFGNADKDGVKNFRDCKPFDIKRQGRTHEEKVKGRISHLLMGSDIMSPSYAREIAEREITEEED